MSSIYLGNINPGLVRAEMASSVVRAANAGAISYVNFKVSPPYLDIHRNVVVEHFLTERDESKLLFVDSDVEFDPDQIRALDAVNEGVVSGWYANSFGDDKGVRPVVYGWGQREESPDEHHSTVQYKTFEEVEELPEVHDRVCQIVAAGAGFLMIDREVLVKMGQTFALPQPWFIEQGVVGAPGEDPVWHGEDLLFGMRSSQIGYPWHLHKDVRVLHYKTCKV